MLTIGSVIDGKYKILSEVGRGGMSVVYMAINERANKTWAVKEVRRDATLHFEAVREGLAAETDILKSLHHPCLPSIVDIIEDEESFVIVMDYIEGNSLAQILRESGPQPQEEVVEWAKQLCDVLIYLHTRQSPIIYRDLKPANIMLRPDGRICLIDFGTARVYKGTQTEDTTCFGTLGYAAPEQFGGLGQTDARTDIYCLGATLYHLLTGKNPSEPPYEIRPIRSINPALSFGLEKIIEKCTKKNPNERYGTCAELLYDLKHYDQMEKTYRRKQQKKLAAFAAASGLALLSLVSAASTYLAASDLANERYEAFLYQAKTSSGAPSSYLLQALSLPQKAGEAEAYLDLIDYYKQDGVFSAEEEEELVTVMQTYKNELYAKKQNYVTVNYEIGKLYWYYYAGAGEETEGPISRAKSAAKWFYEVIDCAPETYENLGLAEVYYTTGQFYQMILDAVLEGTDRGMYQGLFDSLFRLMEEVAADPTETEMVRLQMCSLALSAISQYAASFRADGVTWEQMRDLYESVQNALGSITSTSETTAAMQQEQQDMLPEAKEDILMIYEIKEESWRHF